MDYFVDLTCEGYHLDWRVVDCFVCFGVEGFYAEVLGRFFHAVPEGYLVLGRL